MSIYFRMNLEAIERQHNLDAVEKMVDRNLNQTPTLTVVRRTRMMLSEKCRKTERG